MKELFGLKDENGVSYKVFVSEAFGLRIPWCVLMTRYDSTNIPEKKKLPRTKAEYGEFLGAWANRHCSSTNDFLKDYED